MGNGAPVDGAEDEPVTDADPDSVADAEPEAESVEDGDEDEDAAGTKC